MAGFQSFAERYIIERAASFTKGKEVEEAWTATLDARTIFEHITQMEKKMYEAAGASPVKAFISGNAGGGGVLGGKKSGLHSGYATQQVVDSAEYTGWATASDGSKRRVKIV